MTGRGIKNRVYVSNRSRYSSAVRADKCKVRSSALQRRGSTRLGDRHRLCSPQQLLTVYQSAPTHRKGKGRTLIPKLFVVIPAVICCPALFTDENEAERLIFTWRRDEETF